MELSESWLAINDAPIDEVFETIGVENADYFETHGLKAFRENYPQGRNFVISHQTSSPFIRETDNLEITFANATDLPTLL